LFFSGANQGTATTDVVEALEDQIQNIKEQQYIDASH